MSNMNEQPKVCSLLNMIDTVKRCSEAGERFCFILGAGASVSSGIASGFTMAAQWLDDLKKLEPEMVDAKIKEYNINESDIGSYYSKIYEIRFNTHPHHGYVWLQDAMKNAKPGLGYYHLAKILAADKTTINLVITTNFDSLTEDAIFMYTDKKPLVLTHELLAQYMDFLANRPIIAKIHRDLMLRPKNMEDEIGKLAESWEQILKKALSIYAPIVIGYGGNDESLMGLLEKVVEENGMEKPIYWCHIHDSPPKNEKIIKLLNKCGGFLVPITDFDTAMYLFGVEFGHKFSENSLTKQTQNRIDDYKEKHKEIMDSLEKEQNRRRLFDDEKAVVNAISKSMNNEIKELTEDLKKSPGSAKAHYRRGVSYRRFKNNLDAITDFTKAIELEPDNADFYNCRGVSYNHIKEFDKAIMDHAKAIEFDPNNAKYYRERGVNYYWLNKYEKAIDDFTKAIELAPNNADYCNSRGMTYNHLNEYEKAIDDFTKAIELDNENARYYAWLSYSLYKVGNTDKAFSALEKAMTFKEEALCYSHRGIINLKIAKLNRTECNPEVLEDLTKAIELEEKYRLHKCYTDFAEYYLYTGEIENAYDNLQKALNEYNLYGRAWYYLAKYYELKENIKEYKRCMAKSKECRFIPNIDD